MHVAHLGGYPRVGATNGAWLAQDCDVPQTTPQSAQSGQTFTAGQLATGFGVSGQTIRNWRRAGRLHGVRVGREMHYSLAEVAALHGSRRSAR